MNITTDQLAVLPTASAAATVALIHAKLLLVGGNQKTLGQLDRAAASAFIARCRRIAPGPVVLILLHSVREWIEVLQGLGMHVTHQSVISDSLDVVVGTDGPIKLPLYDGYSLSELTELLTRSLSRKGDSVLVPEAEVANIALAVRAAGRSPTIQTPTNVHKEQIEAAFTGGLNTVPISTDTIAIVLNRLTAGERLTEIAASLGLWVGALSRRLVLDGHRQRPTRGRVYGHPATG